MYLRPEVETVPAFSLSAVSFDVGSGVRRKASHEVSIMMDDWFSSSAAGIDASSSTSICWITFVETRGFFRGRVSFESENKIDLTVCGSYLKLYEDLANVVRN